MPTVAEIAKEMGVDLAAVDPKFIARIDTHVSEADTKFTSAQTLRTEAEENLRRVQEENATINANIARYGATEADNATLRANYASAQASLKALKDAGFSVDVPPELTKVPPANNGNKNPGNFDPDAFQRKVGSEVAQAMDASNEYFRIYGQPLPISVQQLATEANRARKPILQYAEEKYAFQAKREEKAAADQKAHDEKIAADAVKAYQEKHPNTAGNPDMQRGVDSRFPQVQLRKDAKDLRNYIGLPAREKIAQSVGRVKQVLAENQS